MATPRTRRRPSKRQRRAHRKALLGGGTTAALTVVFWSSLWPYLLAAALLTGAGALGWWLWRTDRLLRGGDKKWRHEESIKFGHRSLAEIDTMSGGDFEDYVAELCRRDACTQVRRVGGAHDNGADVRGLLPDGRSMVIQCKRYAPHKTIPGRDMRELLASKIHFMADVAIFVTTSRFSPQAQDFALKHGLLAIHRDHLGLWNTGASLTSFSAVNGRGQGTRSHATRWQDVYGPRRRRRKKPRPTTE